MRHTDDGFEQHGFVNVLLATARAAGGADADALVDVLTERGADSLVDEVRDLTVDEAAEARRWFRSFGSCCRTEPLDDLIGLGFVESPRGVGSIYRETAKAGTP